MPASPAVARNSIDLPSGDHRTDGTTPSFPACELFGWAAGDRLAPDLTNGTIPLPVGPGQRVDDEPAVG